MLRNRAKRKYGTVAQEIQFSKFYRTAIILKPFLFDYICKFSNEWTCTRKKNVEGVCCGFEINEKSSIATLNGENYGG